MKELEVFTINAGPALLFVGFVVGLFVVAVFFVWLSWVNAKLKKQQKQFDVAVEFMEAYYEAHCEKQQAICRMLVNDALGEKK